MSGSRSIRSIQSTPAPLALCCPIQEEVDEIFADLVSLANKWIKVNGVSKDCVQTVKTKFENMMYKMKSLEDEVIKLKDTNDKTQRRGDDIEVSLNSTTPKWSPKYFTGALQDFDKKTINDFIEYGKIDQLEVLVKKLPDWNRQRFAVWKDSIRKLARADETEKMLQDIEQKNLELQNEMSTLNQDLEKAKKSSRRLEDDNEKHTRKISLMETQLEKKNNESAHTTKLNENKQSAYIKEINDLNTAKIRLENTISRLEQKNQKKEQDHRYEVDNLVKNMSDLKTDLLRMSSSKNELHDRVAKLRAEIENKSEVIKNKKSESLRAAAGLSLYLKSTKNCKEELAKLKLSVNDIDQEEYDVEIRKLSDTARKSYSVDNIFLLSLRMNANTAQKTEELVKSINQPNTDINPIKVPRFFPEAYLAAKERKNASIYRNSLN